MGSPVHGRADTVTPAGALTPDRGSPVHGTLGAGEVPAAPTTAPANTAPGTVANAPPAAPTTAPANTAPGTAANAPPAAPTTAPANTAPGTAANAPPAAPTTAPANTAPGTAANAPPAAPTTAPANTAPTQQPAGTSTGHGGATVPGSGDSPTQTATVSTGGSAAGAPDPAPAPGGSATAAVPAPGHGAGAAAPDPGSPPKNSFKDEYKRIEAELKAKNGYTTMALDKDVVKYISGEGNKDIAYMGQAAMVLSDAIGHMASAHLQYAADVQQAEAERLRAIINKMINNQATIDKATNESLKSTEDFIDKYEEGNRRIIRG
jgi:hypothetical protein